MTDPLRPPVQLARLDEQHRPFDNGSPDNRGDQVLSAPTQPAHPVLQVVLLRCQGILDETIPLILQAPSVLATQRPMGQSLLRRHDQAHQPPRPSLSVAELLSGSLQAPQQQEHNELSTLLFRILALWPLLPNAARTLELRREFLSLFSAGVPSEQRSTSLLKGSPVHHLRLHLRRHSKSRCMGRKKPPQRLVHQAEDLLASKLTSNMSSTNPNLLPYPRPEVDGHWYHSFGETEHTSDHSMFCFERKPYSLSQ